MNIISGCSSAVLSQFQQLIILVWLEQEISGENILHPVVHIGSLNQALSLLTVIYGSPALFAISHLMEFILHETPYRTLLHWYWLSVMKDQNLLGMINCYTIPKKLTCPSTKKKFLLGKKVNVLKRLAARAVTPMTGKF